MKKNSLYRPYIIGVEFVRNAGKNEKKPIEKAVLTTIYMRRR
jgi:hypothetical protein